MPKVEIARRLGVSWQTVHQWDKRRRSGGPSSWKERPRSGRPTKLTARQLTRLRRILVAGARAYGYPTDLWTLKRLAEVMRKEFGVRYTLSGVWRVLRALGFSAQVPLTRAMERDERYIRQWVQTTWPEIFQHSLATGATLVFVDEAGVQSTPNVKRDWAPTGSRPVLKVRGHREKVSVISGVTLEGELFFEVHRHDMTGTEVIWFLEQLLEEIDGKVLVVWDNGGIHRCAEVQTFVWVQRARLEVRRFPPYAPELNPDEGVWNALKDDRLANYCAPSLDELERTVAGELRRLQRSPALVERAMNQTELPIHTVDELMLASGEFN